MHPSITWLLVSSLPPESTKKAVPSFSIRLVPSGVELILHGKRPADRLAAPIHDFGGFGLVYDAAATIGGELFRDDVARLVVAQHDEGGGIPSGRAGPAILCPNSIVKQETYREYGPE